ncbi:unnamed protein product [Phytomonas sp. Hart1]|nr:unnamed protein product [Phytomonas sp. Hart1]|eukprot:CCW68546.1 unnamed protein product [Phytomonas sp. isolate Hart1]
MKRGVKQPFSGLITLILARPISNLGNNNIFEFSSFTPSFINSVYEDLKKQKQTSCMDIGGTSKKNASTAELSHIESPEDDEAFRKKLDNEIYNIFSRIPLPSDPIKVALAHNEDELNEKAEAELIKEVVREAYLRKMEAKKAEELRLKWAEKRLDESKSAKEYFRCRTENSEQTSELSFIHQQTTVDLSDTCSDTELADELTIQRNIDDMEAKIRLLKNRLKSRKRG